MISELKLAYVFIADLALTGTWSKISNLEQQSRIYGKCHEYWKVCCEQHYPIENAGREENAFFSRFFTNHTALVNAGLCALEGLEGELLNMNTSGLQIYPRITLLMIHQHIREKNYATASSKELDYHNIDTTLGMGSIGRVTINKLLFDSLDSTQKNYFEFRGTIKYEDETAVESYHSKESVHYRTWPKQSDLAQLKAVEFSFRRDALHHRNIHRALTRLLTDECEKLDEFIVHLPKIADMDFEWLRQLTLDSYRKFVESLVGLWAIENTGPDTLNFVAIYWRLDASGVIRAEAVSPGGAGVIKIIRKITFRPGEYSVGQTWANRAGTVVENMGAELGVASSSDGLKANFTIAAFPVCFDQECVGVLSIVTTQKGIFSENAEMIGFHELLAAPFTKTLALSEAMRLYKITNNKI